MLVVVCEPLAYGRGSLGQGLLDGVVVAVALDGGAVGFDDEGADFFDGQGFGLVVVGFIDDVVFADGAVEVVGAEGQGDLGEVDALHGPEGLVMGDVVEQ